jgi:hypothetical protein
MQIMRKHSTVYRTKADGSLLHLERQISRAALKSRVLPAVSDIGLFLDESSAEQLLRQNF